MKRKEIARLAIKIKEKGFAMIPLKFYLKKFNIKVEISLAKGKNFFDKRESQKKRDSTMEIRRATKSRRM